MENYSRQNRQWYLIIIGMILVVLFFPVPVIQAKGYEDSNPDDYVTKAFNVTVDFDKSHTATITEEIQVDFRKSHHGITRNIPQARDNTYEIKNISVENNKYEVENSSDNTVIRIGDEDKSLTGDQTYVIHYELEYYKDADKEADFLAHNMLPTEWETSIRSSVLTLSLPESIDFEKMEIYAGKYGEDDPEAWKNKFELSVDSNTMVLTGKKLPKGYGVTIRNVGLKDGYWSEARSFMEAHKTGILVIMIVSGLLAIVAVVLWVRYGRNQEIVETIEFYPPNNMTPAEVGYALDEKLEDSEMMTMVFYLADKGYLLIEPEKKHFILHKVKDVGEDEPEFVRTFFEGMFKNKDNFKTNKSPKQFRKPFEKAKEEVVTAYKENYNEVFSAESCISRYACVLFMALDMAVFCMVLDDISGIYVALLLAAISFFGMSRAWKGFDNLKIEKGKGSLKILTGIVLYAVGIVGSAWLYDLYPVRDHIYVYLISQTVIFLFSLVMQKRTEESVKIIGRLYGFRRFIKEAEYDRILALSTSDPEYFYHILPYAAVLGLETTWTKHFEKIKIPKPEWYQSDETAFLYSGLWCRRMLDSCTRAAIPPVPSSGSSGGYSGGSSGGGFSGGGGGGGGGGGW